MGIVGRNGTGKSTFLNLLQGRIDPDGGKVVIGDTVVFGYYNQDLIKVDENKKVIDVIRDIAEFIPLEKGRQLSAAQFLERFLFDRSMHYQFVHKLSGGEKRRLKLMTVLMSNPNFLILDEPTNDLDIFVLSVLEDYLRSFQGCLIVVSHDRYFMDKMVDHLLVFEGQGEIVDILGNYTDYRKKQQTDQRKERSVSKDIATPVQPVEQLSEKRKLSFKEKEEFKKLEERMEALESEKQHLTAKLSDSTLNGQVIMETGQRLSQVVEQLDLATDRWLELSEYV
jgi:ATP-binding cassette subfamily F protein uup